LPTLLCFNFFPTAQNILNCEAITNTFKNKYAESKFYASPQMAHLVLPDTQADPSANAKHSRTPLKNKQSVSKTKRAIFCPRTKDGCST
jgi:hypothetical protein